MASYLDSAMIVPSGTALVLFQPVLDLSAWAVGALSALLTLSLAIGARAGALVGSCSGDQWRIEETRVVVAQAVWGA